MPAAGTALSVSATDRPVWARCGPGVGPVWARCGPGVGPVWARHYARWDRVEPAVRDAWSPAAEPVHPELIDPS